MSKPPEIVNRTGKRFYVWELNAYPLNSTHRAKTYTVLDEFNMHKDVAIFGPSLRAKEEAERLAAQLNREDRILGEVV